MIYTELTTKAMKLAYNAHHGQYDWTKVPYIFHPIHLAEQMDDEISTCVALLHDVVEDTSISLFDLEQEFPQEVTEAVKSITRDPDTPYFDYIKAVKENPIAKKVKLADLAHNSDFSRFEGCDEESKKKAESLLKRYAKAIAILTD